jgi:hypothetical protein
METGCGRKSFRVVIAGLVVPVAALVLAGCGGGGGGGGGGSNNPSDNTSTITAPTAAVAIDANNANTVAASVMGVMLSLRGLNPDAPILTTSYGHTRSAQIAARHSRNALSRLYQHYTEGQGAQTVTESCGTSGSVTYNIAADNTSLTATFADCAIETSTKISGTVTLTDAAVVEDLSAYPGTYPPFIYGWETESITSSDSALSVPVRIEGGFELWSVCLSADCKHWSTGITSLDTKPAPRVAGTDGTDSWVISFSNDDATVNNVDLMAVGEDMVNAAKFTLASTKMDGSVSVPASGKISVFDLLSHVTDMFPSSGQFTASGANGSNLQLTPVDNAHATVKVDYNNDAIYETTLTQSWNGLMNTLTQ